MSGWVSPPGMSWTAPTPEDIAALKWATKEYRAAYCGFKDVAEMERMLGL